MYRCAGCRHLFETPQELPYYRWTAIGGMENTCHYCQECVDAAAVFDLEPFSYMQEPQEHLGGKTFLEAIGGKP